MTAKFVYVNAPDIPVFALHDAEQRGVIVTMIRNIYAKAGQEFPSSLWERAAEGHINPAVITDRQAVAINQARNELRQR